MKDWILEYWIEALFALVIAGIATAYKGVKARFREQDAIKLGIQVLLRDRIVQCYNHYQEKEYCPIYALENINALYAQYHALGGNGTITELVDRLRSMPTEIK
jgi:hypothetical protein